jgi:heme exporter protein A
VAPTAGSEPEQGASPVIRAHNLAKRYGEKRVLEQVDFELAQGGFLLVTGPNGSGKTTLLRLCAGLAIPTGGELEVGVDRARIGFLAHEPLVYRELTAVENLDLYGRLYRVKERRERIGMLLERFGLWQSRSDRAGSFSRGMLQRLALCRVLLHEPDLLILDEPYSALDDDGVALLDRELVELRPMRTFLVATHDPERVAPLASGRLAFA